MEELKELKELLQLLQQTFSEENLIRLMVAALNKKEEDDYADEQRREAEYEYNQLLKEADIKDQIERLAIQLREGILSADERVDITDKRNRLLRSIGLVE